VKPAKESSPDRHLSIMTANVLTPNRNAEALIALVRQRKPDVLVTLESDQWWQDQLDTLQSEMPHSIKCPLDNLYGMHVYSRLPLEESETRFLVEDDVPSMHALVRLRTGDGLRIHFLHPSPPSPTENTESAERDAELLIFARSTADSGQPIIVTGDLNDVAWSATTRLFRKISGLLDPRVGRGMFNTFHADYPFLRWPLDHLFHSHHFTLRSIERLPPIGSDHFPLFTDLLYTPRHGAAQEGLEADSSDRSWARSKIEEQNVSQTDVPRPGERSGFPSFGGCPDRVQGA
jgi:endonuclease/exonuclease/phosphatase (EEP) superfamily protein YafD